MPYGCKLDKGPSEFSAYLLYGSGFTARIIHYTYSAAKSCNAVPRHCWRLIMKSNIQKRQGKVALAVLTGAYVTNMVHVCLPPL